MASPRFDPLTGLSRYRPEGIGIPPETESTHFVHVLAPYASKYGMQVPEFIQAYNRSDDTITEPELDEYFLHDRAVRESGHDTSYRLENVAANLATIDLNALLYKYETDIAHAIHKHFKDHLSIPADMCRTIGGMKPDQVETSAAWSVIFLLKPPPHARHDCLNLSFDSDPRLTTEWTRSRRAKNRRRAVDQYLWNEENGMYFDYDTVKRKRKQTTYESATTFWAMWAGLATPAQAAALVKKALPKLEAFGGLVSGTEHSRGIISIERPSRQWDYPYGTSLSIPTLTNCLRKVQLTTRYIPRLGTAPNPRLAGPVPLRLQRGRRAPGVQMALHGHQSFRGLQRRRGGKVRRHAARGPAQGRGRVWEPGRRVSGRGARRVRVGECQFCGWVGGGGCAYAAGVGDGDALGGFLEGGWWGWEPGWGPGWGGEGGGGGWGGGLGCQVAR